MVDLGTKRWAAVATVVFAGLLGACGSSSSHAAAGGTNAAPAGASGGTAAPGATAASATSGGAATCSQITKAIVQPLIAKPITKVTVTKATVPLGGPTNDGQECVFAIADNSNAVTIVVAKDKHAASTAFSADTTGFGHPVAVPGIGDHANRDGDHDTPQLTSIKGDTYCSVTPQSDEMPGVGKLMEAAGDTNNIGDGPFATIAVAVGTLCNRVYGSGNTTPDLSSITAAAAHASPATTDLTLPTLPPGLKP